MKGSASLACSKTCGTGMSAKHEPSSGVGGPRRFETTRWTLVRAAADRSSPDADAALATLCRTYWYPLYAYVRRRGHAREDARDLTQAFFVKLLEEGTIRVADPRRGRFRSFLLAALQNFVANQERRARTARRGSGRAPASLDFLDFQMAEGRYAKELAHTATPEQVFERRWAFTVLEAVVDQLGREYADAGKATLFLRHLAQLEATALAGTEGGHAPFFSPDSEWVGFVTDDHRLRKVSVLGGPPATIAELGGLARGLSWGSDDQIVFATDSSQGLRRVPAVGGEPGQLTGVDSMEEGTQHVWPEVLPGGRGVVFTVWSGAVASSHLAVLSLETGEVVPLLPGGSQPRYSPTGHLVYGAAGTLWGVGFDPDRLRLTGSAPVPVVENVNTNGVSGAANFSLAHDGSLAYIVGGVTDGIARRSLVWVDREGREEPLALPPRGYGRPRVSPDGSQVGLTIADPENTDVWVLELSEERLTRLTFDAATDMQPVWTPNGRHLIFSSDRDGSTQLFVKAADGTGGVERLTESETEQVAQSVTPDGRGLLVEVRSEEGGNDLALLSLEGDAEARALLDSRSTERNGEVSPDGRWLAYESDASGRFEVYIQPFPNVEDGKWAVSTDGGTRPVWAPDGREIFYAADSHLMRVSVQTDPTPELGVPEVVFEGAYGVGRGEHWREFDIAPTRQRFLMLRPGQGVARHRAQLVLIQHWLDELRRLVPGS